MSFCGPMDGPETKDAPAPVPADTGPRPVVHGGLARTPTSSPRLPSYYSTRPTFPKALSLLPLRRTGRVQPHPQMAHRPQSHAPGSSADLMPAGMRQPVRPASAFKDLWSRQISPRSLPFCFQVRGRLQSAGNPWRVSLPMRLETSAFPT